MKLRSIPPANRQRQASSGRISSMRAATQTGFTFVGGHVGSISHQQLSTEDHFTPRVVAPSPGTAKMRQTLQAAMANLTEQLGALRQIAEDAGEMAEVEFWEKALARLREGR